jgi:alkanesulfonate monooxygenase SsuD/methylene tetrahydromethanopterin reductase-like flavin-dependent oxidoreductase (luciferase family)
MRTLSASAISVGYLLPTRDAITHGRPETEPLLRLGERAEGIGFDAVWVGDSPLARARHDALLMLAALAARTEEVTLGTAVLLPALRQPLLLAQAISTLDRLAAGRAVLGVGAGFPFPATQQQFAALGVPYERRVRGMAESVTGLRRLFAANGHPTSYSGEIVGFEDVVLEPAPERPGGPPIWLAGIGESAERRMGRIGDGWLPYPPTPEQYAQSLRRVHQAAAAAGRDCPPVPGLYATVAIDDDADRAEKRLRANVERYYGMPLELVRSVQAMCAVRVEDVGAWLGDYVDAGARHLILRVADEQPERGLESAGPVRARLAARDAGRS